MERKEVDRTSKVLETIKAKLGNVEYVRALELRKTSQDAQHSLALIAITAGFKVAQEVNYLKMEGDTAERTAKVHVNILEEVQKAKASVGIGLDRINSACTELGCTLEEFNSTMTPESIATIVGDAIYQHELDKVVSLIADGLTFVDAVAKVRSKEAQVSTVQS